MSAATPLSLTSLPSYLEHFASLFHDRRSAATFAQIVGGILAAGSLVCARIAAHCPSLAHLKDPAQRVIRFATGESTSRSKLDADSLLSQQAQAALQLLAQAPPDEQIWLIIDCSELRKPHARAMPNLMQVRDLDGELVPGYRTINVIAVTRKMRVLLYHHLFSSTAPDFVSEPREVQLALQAASNLLAQLEPKRSISWIMDSGFDDIAVWRTIWEQGEQLLCRLKHLDRLLDYRTRQGEWQAGDVAAAAEHLLRLGRFETLLEVRLKGQKQAKEQPVTVLLSACQVRLSYDGNVRRQGAVAPLHKQVWLVRVEVADSLMEPWYLMTDWTVESAQEALVIFRMYRQRWSLEDSFSFIKGMLGWEEVQLLDLAGIRMLVALGWVAAGYIYEIQGSWQEADIRWLAKRGGWAERKDRKPGKKVLLWGLQSILDYLLTRQELERYRAEHGSLPPAVIALLGEERAKDL